MTKRRSKKTLPIVEYPNDALRAKCTLTLPDTKYRRKIIEELFATMIKNGGVGLASPQVGYYFDLFVMQTQKDKFFQACYQPSIIYASKETSTEMEGCLSIPGVSRLVERPKKIVVSHLDGWTGNKVEGWLTDLDAHIFQHELDHLSGRLIIDHPEVKIDEEEYD